MQIKLEEFADVTEVVFDDTHVTVFHPRTRWGNPSGATINWPALGSVSPEEAENFAKGILKAVEMARQLNQKMQAK